jgi:hypothetical protein
VASDPWDFEIKYPNDRGALPVSTLQRFAVTTYSGAADGLPDTVIEGYYIVEGGRVYLSDAKGRPYAGARRVLYRHDNAERVAREVWSAKFGSGRDYRYDDIPIKYRDPRFVAPV